MSNKPTAKPSTKSLDDGFVFVVALKRGVEKGAVDTATKTLADAGFVVKTGTNPKRMLVKGARSGGEIAKLLGKAAGDFRIENPMHHHVGPPLLGVGDPMLKR